MTDDIVARLRVLNYHAKKLAENESLHDLHRDAFTRCEDLTWRAADEVERLRAELVSTTNKLTAERDQARRSYCRAFVDIFPNPKYEELNLEDAAIEVAKEFGWECFNEAGR